MENYKQKLTEQESLKSEVENLKKALKENDDTYIVKDKEDRMDCCQALKKKERVKKLKLIYEKVKKQIKEKYKFCNLYVKNLPDNFSDESLREIFAKYGEIRSCKTVRKELYTSYLGIKRSVKVFGFVCFFEAAQAREAKANLHGLSLGSNNMRLFVDYFQSKQERSEYLKLKMINQSNKMQKNLKPGEMPPMLRNMPMGGQRQFPNQMNNNQMQQGQQFLRKFPPQSNINNNNMNYMNQKLPMHMQGKMNLEGLDKNQIRDYYGERLFTKISTNPQFSTISAYFPRIIGIFLDLQPLIIENLINDDDYFGRQVNETVKVKYF